MLAIIRALLVAVRRDLAGYGAIRTNNFFLFVALLIWGALRSGVEPASSYPFLAALALLLCFPLSSDPMEKIPRTRLWLWPLEAKARILLRIAALCLNPLVWVTVALLARGGGSMMLPVAGLVAAATVRARAAVSAPGFAVGRLVPNLPLFEWVPIAGRLRAMIPVLDTWLALLIAVIGTFWRWSAPSPDPAGRTMLAVLAGIALSTQAQCGADLDGARYRLLPAPGWRILLWRDVAYLLIQTFLTLGLDPLAGITFGLAAIAAGRYPQLYSRLGTARWRFASGGVLFGALQMIVGVALVFAGWPGVLLAALIWVASLWWGGRALVRRS